MLCYGNYWRNEQHQNQEQSRRQERLPAEGGAGWGNCGQRLWAAIPHLRAANDGAAGAGAFWRQSPLHPSSQHAPPMILTQTATPQLKWDKVARGKLGRVNVVNAASAVSPLSNEQNWVRSFNAADDHQHSAQPFPPRINFWPPEIISVSGRLFEACFLASR